VQCLPRGLLIQSSDTTIGFFRTNPKNEPQRDSGESPHLLVHAVLGREERTQTRSVDGIQAGVEPDGHPRLAKANRVLGHLEALPSVT
jgi:hypothetical protein